MTYIFGNWLKCLRNDQSMWEMTFDLFEMSQICVEMTKLIDKRLKNVENDEDVWEMAKIFRKWLRYMAQGLSI